MAHDNRTAQANVLDAVIGKFAPGKAEHQLARLLLSGADVDAFENLDADVMAAEVSAIVAFMGDRQRSRPKIEVRPLAGVNAANGRQISVLQVLNDDMPFLVDSVVGELQASGLSPSVFRHPIFKIARSGTGLLEKIVGPGDRNWGDGTQESLMIVHLPRLSAAEADGLVERLGLVLGDVRRAVTDWPAMLARVDRAIQSMEQDPPPVAPGLLAETLAFCRWLRSGQFTFLGLRDYRLTTSVDGGELVPAEGSSLGVMRDASLHMLARNGEPLAVTEAMRRSLLGTDPLLVNKASILSRVHRRVPMDYVALKSYAPDGSVTGELRLVGLFTSLAYTQPPREIPFVRHKVDAVISASGLPPASHAGKALANVLDTFPRDDLFQISTDELKAWSTGILDLELRPRVRVFTRVDLFDRFATAMVFIPRDRFSTQSRERVAALLEEAFNGRVTSFTPFFTEGRLVRVSFAIDRNEGSRPALDEMALEARIAEETRSWSDRIWHMVDGTPGLGGLGSKYCSAFPSGYLETLGVDRALEDIKRIERMQPEHPAAIDFYREPGAPLSRVRASIFRFGEPIPLSERVPELENLGFSVIDERSYRVKPQYADGKRAISLHDMVLQTADGSPVDLDLHDDRMEETYLAVFGGETDNDGFNRLVIVAGANWREAQMLRAYAAYMRQIGTPFGPRYIADTLHRHAGLCRDLIELFRTRFDPDLAIDSTVRANRQAAISTRIEGALAGVPSLDEDRILRHLLNLVRSTLRTSFFCRTSQGGTLPTMAFKFDPKAIDGLPDPKPFREIWVYGPRVEGVHLRFGPIARGGIRWSDRAQDFRTEVLGLCKAQQVKNTVIVPTGSKGGFLPKRLPRSGQRDEVMKEGIAAYEIFISSLLDVTDNYVDGVVVPPPRVVRHELDDPYLVVAADKGTATFSDYANTLSTTRGFWLGDAFASGGSVGYDHKKMAITARGAWESVRRHFREIDVDIQTTPFDVIGVGDMSGDVFGNGMLLSPVIRLVAAFDHRDIFIDPNPDFTTSFTERKRMFALARSSWQDYDRSLISAGGGVFARSAKSIALSPEIKARFAIAADTVTPAELMKAILKAKADLMWFGGIGTYVRATSETDEQVGDRANDAIRVTGIEVGAKVIGEGANLALTQRGRIEFASRGGRLNTDFIDNSAGVNSSDQEVNIKIALGGAINSGRLAAGDRNALLATMTDDVAAACLVNNYQQSLAISLAERGGTREVGYLGQLMRHLEQRDLLDRRLEALPKAGELSQRQAAGGSLTRPELAVLLSWSKIALNADLLASSVPDDLALQPLLIEYFPPALRERFNTDLVQHRLAREIVATRVTNSMINRGGPTFAVRLADETGRSISEIAYAYLAARSVLRLPELWQETDRLDNRIAGGLQLDLYAATQQALLDCTAKLLRSSPGQALDAMIREHAPIADAIAAMTTDQLPASQRTAFSATSRQLIAGGVPAKLAERYARLPVLGRTAAIAALVSQTGRTAYTVAAALFAAEEYMRFDDIRSRAETARVADYFDRVAVSSALGTLENAGRSLALDALKAGADADAMPGWLAGQGSRFGRAKAALDELAGAGDVTVSRLYVAASQVRDLASR